MRITGHRLMDLTTAATRDAIGDVAAAGQVASSGKRVERPSEDPAAWLAAHRAQARRAVDDGAKKAIDHARTRLALTDHALASLGDMIARARELAIQGSNDTLGAPERATIAVEVREMFRSALAAANTRSVEGEYVLGGTAGTTEPFDANGAYVGDAGFRAIDAGDGEDHQMTVAGSALTAAAGGVDVLPLFARLADALAANDAATVQQIVGELDTAGDQISQARSQGGSLLAAVEDADRARDGRDAQLEATIAHAVDADFPLAAGELGRAVNALEAARAVAARVIAAISPRRS